VATGQSHHLIWLLGGAVVVVMLLFSVLVYPSLTSNQTSPTGARPVMSSTSERGLQFLGQPEPAGTGTEWPAGTSSGSTATERPSATAATAEATSTATIEPGPGAADESASAPARVSSSTSNQAPSASSAPPAGTSSTGTSSTGTSSTGTSSTATSTSNSPRAVAQALFPEFGFPDNEFGCLNAAWNRLGLWSTAAAVRPGLIYVQSRYGTPCAAWDHVRKTGSY
jgi:hypothetical protein